ncbi:hypothetical protein B0T24DRAFT_289118 [Lasiosphaeria ovina]|uniref:F-box domain-containing protein n=1 Tax=Lasiosphaeria ovina TaxID=92902 RepID=A0AAE0N8Q0_9PEZI|nr:hypothetical protein B0T24DRAFT_289118 [Lasiosphaeria ovina]
MPRFQSLPNEAILQIAGYLDAKDFRSLRAVSKWLSVATTHIFVCRVGSISWLVTRDGLNRLCSIVDQPHLADMIRALRLRTHELCRGSPKPAMRAEDYHSLIPSIISRLHGLEFIDVGDGCLTAHDIDLPLDFCVPGRGPMNYVDSSRYPMKNEMLSKYKMLINGSFRLYTAIFRAVVSTLAREGRAIKGLRIWHSDDKQPSLDIRALSLNPGVPPELGICFESLTSLQLGLNCLDVANTRAHDTPHNRRRLNWLPDFVNLAPNLEALVIRLDQPNTARECRSAMAVFRSLAGRAELPRIRRLTLVNIYVELDDLLGFWRRLQHTLEFVSLQRAVAIGNQDWSQLLPNLNIIYGSSQSTSDKSISQLPPSVNMEFVWLLAAGLGEDHTPAYYTSIAVFDGMGNMPCRRCTATKAFLFLFLCYNPDGRYPGPFDTPSCPHLGIKCSWSRGAESSDIFKGLDRMIVTPVRPI